MSTDAIMIYHSKINFNIFEYYARALSPWTDDAASDVIRNEHRRCAGKGRIIILRDWNSVYMVDFIGVFFDR